MVTDKRVIANKFNDFFTSIGLKLANNFFFKLLTTI